MHLTDSRTMYVCQSGEKICLKVWVDPLNFAPHRRLAKWYHHFQKCERDHSLPELYSVEPVLLICFNNPSKPRRLQFLLENSFGKCRALYRVVDTKLIITCWTAEAFYDVILRIITHNMFGHYLRNIHCVPKKWRQNSNRYNYEISYQNSITS